jgi:hypothetical protein
LSENSGLHSETRGFRAFSASHQSPITSHISHRRPA